MNVSVGGCLKQNTAFIRERKRKKVAVGPGSRECKAGYETNNCGEQNISVLRWVLRKELGRYRFQISRHRER